MGIGNLLSNAIAPLISGALGLVGVIAGVVLTLRNQKVERRQRFVREQLSEFYGPMRAMIQRHRAKAATRVRVSDAARAEWPRLMEEAHVSGIEHLTKRQEELSPKFKKIIEHDNQQLKEEFIPLCHQMVDIFTTKMHLTEPSIRKHFAALVEFVELLDRYLGGNLPGELTERIGPDEQNLMPFYNEVETQFEALSSKLRE